MRFQWLSLLILSSSATLAADTGYVRCHGFETYVYLYQTVDNFEVLGNLDCGQKVEVLDPQNKSRVKVRTTDGKEGYVLQSELTASATGSQQQETISLPSTNASIPAEPSIFPAGSVRLPSASVHSPVARYSSEERAFSRIETFGGYSVVLPSSTALRPLNGFAAIPYFGSIPVNNSTLTAMSGFDSLITVNGNEWLGVDGGFSYDRASINATSNLSSPSCPSGQILIDKGLVCVPGTSPSFTLPIHNLFFGAGPRFTYRHGPFAVFGHFLIGYDRTSSDNRLMISGGVTGAANTLQLCATGLAQQQSPCMSGGNNTILTSVAFSIGGGADISWTRHLAVRFQFDAFPTRQNQQSQLNEKISVGPVISFK